MRNGTRHFISPRAFVRALFLALPVLYVLLAPARAEAYSWMIRHSYGTCNVCHADPSGGETLTAYGRAQSDILLSMRWDGKSAEESEPSSASNFLGFVSLPDPVMLGGSLRMASTLRSGDLDVFPMQMDLYGQARIGSFFFGGSLGLARVDAGSPHARAAQVTTGQGKVMNLLSRTHYVGMDFAEGQYMVRAGRLNLPFGIRVPEHTLWARESTRTDRESDQQHGVALAYNTENVRAEGMIILGNYQISPDEFRERGYSFYLEVMAAERATFGVSSLYTLAKRDRLTLDSNTVRGAHGVFTRVALLDPLALLAEVDLLTDSTRKLGYTGFAQLDYEVLQGLHGMFTVEGLDAGYPRAPGDPPTKKIPGVGKLGMGYWVSAAWFFLPHLDLRVDGIVRPSEFTLLTQLHAFL
jgi:hypothetical protein